METVLLPASLINTENEKQQGLCNFNFNPCPLIYFQLGVKENEFGVGCTNGLMLKFLVNIKVTYS